MRFTIAPAASRTQLAYSRYWEGRTQLQTLTSKLTDFIVQCDTFDRMSLPDKPTDDERAAYSHFRDTLVHLVSLLHAVALATLRDDFDMENIKVRASNAHAHAGGALHSPSMPGLAQIA